MTDYTQYTAPLLILAGGAFQWVRQWQKVNDAWTYVFAAALALGVYLLTLDYSAHAPVQQTIITGILWLGEHTSVVLGGTFIASGIAKAGVSAVPMTNSK